MTEEEYLLDLLKEECAEVIQRATKASRFGLQESQSGYPSNEERLTYEINDLYAVLDLLHTNHVVNTARIESLIQDKKIKINKYKDYSEELGILKC